MNLGLVKQIGDGKDSNVWSTNWLLDTSALPPMYQQDSLVDITLKVCDLFIPNTDIWDKKKVRETLTPEDAERVLRLKPSLSRLDSDVWGLTKHMVILRRVPINFCLWSMIRTTPHIDRSLRWNNNCGKICESLRLCQKSVIFCGEFCPELLQ